MRLPTPRELCRASPTSPEIEQFVERARQRIRQCLEVEDERLLVIVGPCSVQDPDSLLGYAERLSQLQRQLSDRLLLVLRAHFEKPRTSTGWKGFLYDPHLNGSNDMPYALRTMRQLLLELAHMELPVATEFLEPTTPAYIGDLISWATVGARTVASQIHRQMASGLSMPVGFKNTPEGDIETALHALQTARLPHSFPTINPDGQLSLITTSGNQGYLVLRGGCGQPNYDSAPATSRRLLQEGLPTRLLIDCSHDNCGRQSQRQINVFRHLIQQHSPSVGGLMLESNLLSGSQPARHPLTPGLSITDPCIDWPTTQSLLEWAHSELSSLAYA